MKKIVFGILILFLLIGAACATEKNYPLTDTQPVAEDFGELWIDGKKVATIDQYDDANCIEEKILSQDDGAIIKQVTKEGAKEVSSVDDSADVYEFLTEKGMYYTFGKDGKFYIVTIDESQWNADMLKKMDEWCLENSK